MQELRESQLDIHHSIFNGNIALYDISDGCHTVLILLNNMLSCDCLLAAQMAYLLLQLHIASTKSERHLRKVQDAP